MVQDIPRAVVQAGAGRGFVIEIGITRYVVTASHCLPHLPEPHPGASFDERTYGKIIGALGDDPTIAAECVFVDPVADIALLCAPDNQELGEEAARFEELVEAAVPLPIAGLSFVRETLTLPSGTSFLGPRQATAEARLLSLDGVWFGCRVRSQGRGLLIQAAEQGIRSGMSGSPIVDTEGRAIGIVSISFTGADGNSREGGPNPELAAHLPAWTLL